MSSGVRILHFFGENFGGHIGSAPATWLRHSEDVFHSAAPLKGADNPSGQGEF